MSIAILIFTRHVRSSTRAPLPIRWGEGRVRGAFRTAVHGRNAAEFTPGSTSAPFRVYPGAWARKSFWQGLAIVRDISQRKKLEAEREFMIKSLEEALASERTLRGLVPICSYCKKIRDDRGFWGQVEAWVAAHSEAKFSHGICPDCVSKHFSEHAEPSSPRATPVRLRDSTNAR